VGGPVFDAVGHLLAATKRTVIATGILNLWMHSPDDVAEAYAELTAAHGDRFLLGIGVSHAPLIDAGQPGRYRKPLAATASFLDALDAAHRPVPPQRRVLATPPTRRAASGPTGCARIWRCRITPITCCAAGSPKTIWHT
jgi:alkanesulfonate monooxygenase SsuD/methylene tetrahydromethanopterin reductase-like flavin-dependent oxidoreductase (luciferase family)